MKLTLTLCDVRPGDEEVIRSGAGRRLVIMSFTDAMNLLGQARVPDREIMMALQAGALQMIIELL